MQITVRLNEYGEREIQKIKEAYCIKKNAPALEFALLGYSVFTKRVFELEQEKLELQAEKLELQAIISYLESKKEEGH